MTEPIIDLYLPTKWFPMVEKELHIIIGSFLFMHERRYSNSSSSRRRIHNIIHITLLFSCIRVNNESKRYINLIKNTVWCICTYPSICKSNFQVSMQELNKILRIFLIYAQAKTTTLSLSRVSSSRLNLNLQFFFICNGACQWKGVKDSKLSSC
jgi:hypothetical protein